MTLAEVMTLKGRDLDAAVAVRMGWKWVYSPDSVGEYQRFLLSPEDLDRLGTYYHEAPEYLTINWSAIRDLPHYSSDWNDAMKVRKWVRGSGREISLRWYHAVATYMDARLGDGRHPLTLVWSEPIDYARAALLVEQPS